MASDSSTIQLDRCNVSDEEAVRSEVSPEANGTAAGPASASPLELGGAALAPPPGVENQQPLSPQILAQLALLNHPDHGLVALGQRVANLEEKVAQQRREMGILTTPGIRINNSGCESGRECPYLEVPFSDGTLPTQVAMVGIQWYEGNFPPLGNLDDLGQLTDQMLDSYLQGYGMPNPPQGPGSLGTRRRFLAAKIGAPVSSTILNFNLP